MLEALKGDSEAIVIPSGAGRSEDLGIAGIDVAGEGEGVRIAALREIDHHHPRATGGHLGKRIQMLCAPRRDNVRLYK